MNWIQIYFLGYGLAAFVSIIVGMILYIINSRRSRTEGVVLSVNEVSNSASRQLRPVIDGFGYRLPPVNKSFFAGFRSVHLGTVLSRSDRQEHPQLSNSQQIVAEESGSEGTRPPTYTNGSHPAETSTVKPPTEHRPFKPEQPSHCYGSTVKGDEGSDGNSSRKWETFQ